MDAFANSRAGGIQAASRASVLGRSVLRDSYDGKQLTKALSYISVTASVMPIIAPVFGGWIAFHLNWEAVFIFVLLYLVAIFTLGWYVLPETLPYAPRAFKPKQVLQTYGKLIVNPQVIGSASYNWISYLTAVVSLSLFPFLMQHELGLTAAEYGSIMIIPSAGLMMGSVSLNILNRYFSNSWILFLAIVLSAVAGLWLLMVEMTVFNLLLAFTVLTIAQGLSFPISIALLLGPHKTQAGSVSALSGSIQMVIAGVFGGVLGHQPSGIGALLSHVCFIDGGSTADEPDSTLWATCHTYRQLALSLNFYKPVNEPLKRKRP